MADSTYDLKIFFQTLSLIIMNADDIDGAIISSGYGSYDTVSGNIVFGKKLENLEISGMLNYTDSNGYNGTVESDSQTIIDRNLSTLGYAPSSLAPGSVDDWRREYDMDWEHSRFFVKMPLAGGRGRIVIQASCLRVKYHKQDACVTMYN